MSEINDQYRFEVESWFRTLDYLQQENIYMKTRIAELIKKDHIHRAGLERLEMYMNMLLDKDTLISFSRKDIRDMEKELKPNKETGWRREALRTDMEKMEKEFCNLKADFNRYMTTMQLVDEVS